uniref:HAD-IIA family hydrolase n=1 Tax=Agathobacter sp. TaxID=2021311 RepID=UPI004057A5FB
MIKETLKQKKLFLFDMDGTIYLDDRLFDGTLDMLDYIKKIGGKAVYITNNSSRNVSGYIERLKKMGIAASEDDFMTSIHVTGMYLSKHHKAGKIYVFGTNALVSALKEEYDLPVTTQYEEDITCLVIGFDTELTFQKLEDASRLLLTKPEISYIATNPDYVCPKSFGAVPDCGSIAQALCNATGRMPKVMGKPEAGVALSAMEKYGYTKEETVLIGDRIYTDITCGVNAGVTAVLVLSGESTMQTVEESAIKPDIILKNVREMHTILTEDS